MRNEYKYENEKDLCDEHDQSGWKVVNSKYETCEEHVNGLGRTLYRIRALKDFGDVKKGDIGGLIEGTNNLSSDGNCWVYDDAMVIGDAQVKNNAKVKGFAKVSDNAKILDFAEVKDKAKIAGDALLTDYVKVSDNVYVFHFAKLYGNSKVYGNATVAGSAVIKGNAEVFDEAKVIGKSNVGSDAKIGGNSVISNLHITGKTTIMENVIFSPLHKQYIKSNKDFKVLYYNKYGEDKYCVWYKSDDNFYDEHNYKLNLEELKFVQNYLKKSKDLEKQKIKNNIKNLLDI